MASLSVRPLDAAIHRVVHSAAVRISHSFFAYWMVGLVACQPVHNEPAATPSSAAPSTAEPIARDEGPPTYLPPRDVVWEILQGTSDEHRRRVFVAELVKRWQNRPDFPAATYADCAKNLDVAWRSSVPGDEGPLDQKLRMRLVDDYMRATHSVLVDGSRCSFSDNCSRRSRLEMYLAYLAVTGQANVSDSSAASLPSGTLSVWSARRNFADAVSKAVREQHLDDQCYGPLVSRVAAWFATTPDSGFVPSLFADDGDRCPATCGDAASSRFYGGVEECNARQSGCAAQPHPQQRTPDSRDECNSQCVLAGVRCAGACKNDDDACGNRCTAATQSCRAKCR